MISAIRTQLQKTILLVVSVFLGETSTAGIFLDATFLDKTTKHVAQDSGVKALVVEGGGGGVFGDVLMSSITETIRLPQTEGKLLAELGGGDEKLRNALVRVLVGLNMSGAEATSQVERWAHGEGGNLSIQKALLAATEKPNCRAALKGYFLEADKDWLNSVIVMRSMLSDANTSTILKQAVVNEGGIRFSEVEKLVDAARNGEKDALWTLATATVKTVATGGGVGRMIQATPPPENSVYYTVWKKVHLKIARDPSLDSRYEKEILGVCDLGKAWDFFFQSAVSERPERVAEGLIEGAQDPNSQYASAIESVLPKSQWFRFYKPNGRPDDMLSVELSRNLPELMGDTLWRRWLSWHCTRPAEALSDAIRGTFLGEFGSNPMLGTKLLASTPLWGERFEELVEEKGGYGSDKSQSRTDAKTDKLDRQVANKFLSATLDILWQDDEVWEDALKASKDNPASLFAAIITESFDRSPHALSAWILTVAFNDSLLMDGFCEFLVENKAFTTHENASEWVIAIGESEKERRTGDNSLFRQKFRDFLGTQNGWRLAHRRLAMEGYKLSGALRDTLSQYAFKNPDLFWRLFSGALAGSGDRYVAITKENIATVFSKSETPFFLLSEIEAGNKKAFDASAPLWGGMLKKNTPFALILQGIITDGPETSPAFVLAIRALNKITVVTQDEITNAKERKNFLSRFFSEDSNIDLWLREIHAQAVYKNQSDVLARQIRFDEASIEQWCSVVFAAAKEDPLFIRVAIESIQKNISGTSPDKTKKIKTDIVRAFFSDKVLAEKAISIPSHSFQQDVAN